VPKYTRKEGGTQQTVTGLIMVEADMRGVKTASASFKIRKPQNLCIASNLNLAVAQAAVLGFERHGAIPKLQREGRFGSVQSCAERGDPLAQLICFSESTLEGKEVANHWRTLEAAPPEVKCLRNYLLSLATKHGQRVGNIVSAEDRKTILPLIGQNDFFAPEIKQALSSSNPSP